MAAELAGKKTRQQLGQVGTIALVITLRTLLQVCFGTDLKAHWVQSKSLLATGAAAQVTMQILGKFYKCLASAYCINVQAKIVQVFFREHITNWSFVF